MEEFKSSGQMIKAAREECELTISDLAFKLDQENQKKLEKRIKSWEANRDFPDINEIYKLCEILTLNPNNLLNFRLHKSRSKYRKSVDSGIFSTEIKINIIRVITIALILVAVYGLFRFYDVVIGASDTTTPKEFENAIEPYISEQNN